MSFHTAAGTAGSPASQAWNTAGHVSTGPQHQGSLTAPHPDPARLHGERSPLQLGAFRDPPHTHRKSPLAWPGTGAAGSGTQDSHRCLVTLTEAAIAPCSPKAPNPSISMLAETPPWVPAGAASTPGRAEL